MKRLILALALAGVVPAVGCSSDEAGGGTSMNNPFKKVDPSTAPKKANYFEINKDGTTYVLGSAASLVALNEGKKLNVEMMPKLGTEGSPVAVENTSFTEHNRLIEEYKKGHSIP